MKKTVFWGCIILMIVISSLLMPYWESISLCKDIEAGKTEDAILKIENMEDVNCGTAPIFMKSALNAVEYNIDLPLILACKKGDYQVAEKLLEKGADPNKYYEGGFTAAEAVFAGNSLNELEMIKLLADYGADMSKAGSSSSPLFEVAKKMIYTDSEDRGDYLAECIKYLLLFDEKLVDENGFSILYYAVVADNVSLIKQLTEEEQLINLSVDNGQTVLFEAVKNNSLETVKLLVENGANKNIEDDTGRKAYDYAVENGYDDIALFLNQDNGMND